MDFGLVQNGVDDVGRTQRNVNVVVVVLVKLRVFMRWNFDVVHADIFIFDFQVMVRLAGRISSRKRDRLLGLGAEREGGSKRNHQECDTPSIEKQIPRCARDNT